MLVACDIRTEKQTAPKMESVRIGIAKTPPSWLFIIADKKSFLKKNGINADITYFKSGKRALNGLLANKVDIATTAGGPIVFQSLLRNDFSIFATIGTSSNDNVIVAARNKGIKTPDDLKGKRMATQEASASHFFMHLCLTEHGFSESDIHPLYMKVEKLPKALVDGTVDAISTREPYYSEAVKALGENAIVFETPGLYLKFFQLVGFNSYLNNNLSIQTKILKALVDSENFVKNNKQEAIKLISDSLDIPEINVIKALFTLELNVKLEQSLILSLEDQARWVINRNSKNKYSMPNYLQFISSKALSIVKPQAISILHSN